MSSSIVRKIYDKLTRFDASSFLRARKEHYTYRTEYVCKKLYEIDHIKIPTYPRFTIYDLNYTNVSDQLIFDSSDFDVISRRFGLYDKSNWKNIANNKHFNFNNEGYLAEHVQVDILDTFEDYTFGTNPIWHTDIYEGRSIPYNIQIIIKARRIED